MGCDIHIYTESKRNGEWVPNENVRLDPYNEGDDIIDVTHDECFFSGRNSILFDTLAGVSGGFYQRFEEKGNLPEDVSSIIQQAWIHDKKAFSCFRPSFITLSELDAYLEKDFRLDLETLNGKLNYWCTELEEFLEEPANVKQLAEISVVLKDMDAFRNGSTMDEEEVWVYNELETWASRLRDFEGDDHRVVFWFDN